MNKVFYFNRPGKPRPLDPARPIAERMEILTVARKLWSQAGRPSGRLGEFWEMAEQRLAAGRNAPPADHFSIIETPLSGRSVAD